MMNSSSLSQADWTVRGAAVGAFGLAAVDWASASFGSAGAAATVASLLALASFRLGRSKKTLRAMGDSLERAAKGDLEARVVLVNDGGEMRTVADNLNRTLDLTDAFTREASATLASVRDGFRHRRIVERGFSGVYALAARTMNEAVATIREREEADRQAGKRHEAEKLAQEEAQRLAEERAIQNEREAVVSSIGAGLSRLAARDMTFRLTGRLPDAYNQLQADFNAAASELEQAMAEVVRGSHSISTMSGEIADGAENLAQRTEQQAATLEQTAAAMEELTATVRNSAEGANRAAEIVHRTMGDAVQSGVVVEEAVTAMGSIEKSSREIEGVVELIEEIAFQTNLLALNASVEAARAGKSGRGFAVVASEVRALSQRSAEAAKDINVLISSSSAQVLQGVELVGRTGAALGRIVGQVTEINKLVAEMATASREQATTLSEVGKAVSTLDETTQKNAAMVEETSAATHALSTKASELLALVGAFTIAGHGTDLRHSRRSGLPRHHMA